MKRTKLKTILLTGLSVFTLLCLFTGTFAWFVNTIVINEIGGKGKTQSAYFAYGDGYPLELDPETGEIIHQPFGISESRHLNNLAWLQYNGAFDDRHYYFELANDINEDGTTYVMPPVGTEEHPFIGVFDGKDHTIYNVKITNDSQTSAFTNKPNNISYTYTDFDIVGFFGVVGKIDPTETSYSSSTNTIKDVTFENIEVESKTANTLIGLAAGYVNADISGVKIGSSKITTNGNSAKAYTSNLSDYALVGYTTKTNSTGEYTQTISEYFESEGEDDTGWGESVAIKDMYEDLHDTYDDSTLVDEHVKTVTLDENGNQVGEPSITTKFANKFRHSRDGTNASDWTNSYSFMNDRVLNSHEETIKLFGSKSLDGVHRYPHRDEKKVLIYSSPYYRGPGPDPAFDANVVVKYSSSNNDDYAWFYTGTATSQTDGADLGYLYAKHLNNDGTTTNYYLTVGDRAGSNSNDIFLKYSLTPTTKWKIVKSGSYFYLATEDNKYYRTGSYTTISSRKQSCTFTFKTSSYSEPYETGEKDTVYDTCFYYDGFRITSGTYISDGDIRVSKHQNTSESFTISNSTILTIKNNNSGVATKMNASSASLDGYSDTVSKFKYTGNTNEWMYGFHFMGASISADDTVTVPSSGYDYPRNSLTFNVAHKGLIKFFAGTYVAGGEAFFSLYKINRTGKTVSSITPIRYVYKKTGSDYYFSNSSTAPAGYTLAFDSNWIENPSGNYELGRFYYFEIPVNRGEYCLGSVTGENGAYLLYLDIGANGSDATDSVSGYYVDTYTSALSYPVGVDFAVAYVQTTADDGGVTFAMSIAQTSSSSPTTGSVEFDLSGNTVTLTIVNTSNLSSFYEYKGADTSKYSITVDSGPAPTDKTAGFAGSTIRTVYAKIEAATGEDYLIEIVGTYANSTFTPTTYYLDGDIVGGMSDIPAAFTDDILNDILEGAAVLTIERVSGGTFNAKIALPWASSTSYYVLIEEDGVEVEVTYTAVIEVTINGSESLDSGDTYTTP